MLADSSKPGQDLHILAPLLLEVLAFELAGLIDNQMLGLDLFSADNPVQRSRHFFG